MSPKSQKREELIEIINNLKEKAKATKLSFEKSKSKIREDTEKINEEYQKERNKIFEKMKSIEAEQNQFKKAKQQTEEQADEVVDETAPLINRSNTKNRKNPQSSSYSSMIPTSVLRFLNNGK